MRVGIGYDVHRFHGKRPLCLGGVVVPHRQGLAGHSDADVLLHALTDALLGAIGAPDIGEHFPSTDPRYRDADSRIFVRAAHERVRREGWRIGNIDTTLIADAPRLSGYKAKMCRTISQLLGISETCVSVKAKTTEGFCPGVKGIAAQAVVLLQPGSSRGRRRRKSAYQKDAGRSRLRAPG